MNEALKTQNNCRRDTTTSIHQAGSHLTPWPSTFSERAIYRIAETHGGHLAKNFLLRSHACARANVHACIQTRRANGQLGTSTLARTNPTLCIRT